jgi:hypothetical protein
VLVSGKGASCPRGAARPGRVFVSPGSSVSLATLVRTGLKKGTTISSPGAITAIRTLTVRRSSSGNGSIRGRAAPRRPDAVARGLSASSA